MTTITRTTTIALTPEAAAAELARRDHNRAARKDDSLVRIEATDANAFRASKDDLLAIAAQATEINTDAMIHCTYECGGCVNGELCDDVEAAIAAGDASLVTYGTTVADCGHGGECAALAGR